MESACFGRLELRVIFIVELMAIQQNNIAVADPEWTTVIRPQSNWFDLRLQELWQYRDLIIMFVRRDFISMYKQTILGPLWYIFQPLISTIVFTIVFGNIAALSTDGLPQFLFYMAGVVMWTYFSSSLTKTSTALVANAAVFGKVYFPRLTVPISFLISNLTSFAIQFIFFALFIVYFRFQGADVNPNLWLFSLPLLVLLMAGLGLGCGIMVSAMTTRYRDLTFLVGFGTQLLMYATSVIYPLSSVSENYRWILLANPMTPIIETFRYGFLGAGTLSLSHLAYSVVVTTVILVIGILMFNKVEQTFMDTI